MRDQAYVVQPGGMGGKVQRTFSGGWCWPDLIRRVDRTFTLFKRC
jgi:hypothetical protein